MARYLYRRASGIYAVRICVPERLRVHFARREIHVSTGTSDPAAAKASAFAILTAWQLRVVELKNMDVIKITEGSPLLTGSGSVRLEDMEKTFGMTRAMLLNEIRNSGADLSCIADGWIGVEVTDMREVERDFDGTYLFDDALSKGVPIALVGEVTLFSAILAVQSFASADIFNDCMFWRDAAKRRAFFCDMDPGQDVHYSQVLIDKTALERIRMRLASGVTPEMLERASSALSRPVSASTAVVPATKNAGMRASVLMEEFLAAKAAHWKPDRQERMAKMCGRFVDLMEDPLLTDINRQLVQAYRKQLLQLPSDVKAARKRHGTSSLKALIKLADDRGEERLAETTALDYVDKLSEMLGWAVLEEYMQRNPAKGISGAVSPRVRVREQDQRQQFSSDELIKIFSAEWFIEGAGKANSAGRFREYQPHYFWLPLLGLYTGGRLNELAQLYLADIKQDVAGTWYIDFNLEGAGKVDDDQGVEISTAGDKSLKTINSVRQVPMHCKLIELGLPLYALALKKAGHDRLFPELSHHHVKGYGKSAGSWFNERYLGNKLQIARDGKKTFHSLRHTLTTALYAADVPQPKVAQVLGHERGESISETRYNKDKIPSELQAYVDMADFKLPLIAHFNIKIGISAVADALDRKKRHAKNLLKAGTKK